MATKPLTWSEIRKRAVKFATDWKDATREQADKQLFWNDWFAIFGLSSRRVGSFEVKAKRSSTGRLGWIDYLWEGVVAVEHKSAGESLDEAEGQNLDYVDSLDEKQVPQLVVSCDFRNFRVTDLVTRETKTFALAELPDNLRRFGPIAGYRKRDLTTQEDASVKAAELLARVYTSLEDNGYVGHDLAAMAVRLLFVLFADDTGVWQERLLEQMIEDRTSEDGSDLGAFLVQVFDVLNTPEDQRQKNLDEDLAQLPYINGGLFKDPIRTPIFDATGRERLLAACAYNWAKVSPAIFGSIFQSVKDPATRREFGSHYTTEANILRIVEPLFLDEFRAEFQDAYNSRGKLRNLRDKLAKLKFLDPAAGSGNFLIITYRELRRLELDVLVRLGELAGHQQQSFDATEFSKIHVGQFYAIEIDEFTAQIAQTAMYLVDHLENMRLSAQFGEYLTRFPITDEAHVTVANACQIDWNTVVPAAELNYILGNPPFVGRQYRDAAQAEDMRIAHADAPGHGPLDYVTAWYAKAVDYMRGNREIRAAFVSTNSVTQGESVGLLWPRLLAAGVHVDFGVRTFKWGNEARNKAAVHCVIVGFSMTSKIPAKRPIFEEHTDPTTKAKSLFRTDAKNINPYLVDAPTVIVKGSRKPIVKGVPSAIYGSMANDGDGFYVPTKPLTEKQRAKRKADAAKQALQAAKDPRKQGKVAPGEFYPEDHAAVDADPIARKYLRRVVGAEELVNGIERYGLWLADAPSSDIRGSAILRGRAQHVRAIREFSNRPTTNQLAKTPTRWGEERQPSGTYIAVPRTSSETREYIPIAILDADEFIANDNIIMVPTNDLFWFGVMQSAMHMAWMRAAGGRLKSDYRYSATLVYNTFPFPTGYSDAARKAVTLAAQAVLDARTDETLAAQYDAIAMTGKLRKSHAKLDAAVDALYGRKKYVGDLDRQTMLFERYIGLTPQQALPGTSGRKAARRGPHAN